MTSNHRSAQEDAEVHCVGKAVNLLRLVHDLSADDLARRAGLPDSLLIERIEQGCCVPTMSVMSRIAEEFGLTLVQMVEVAWKEFSGKRHGQSVQSAYDRIVRETYARYVIADH